MDCLSAESEYPNQIPEKNPVSLRIKFICKEFRDLFAYTAVYEMVDVEYSVTLKRKSII